MIGQLVSNYTLIGCWKKNFKSGTHKQTHKQTYFIRDCWTATFAVKNFSKAKYYQEETERFEDGFVSLTNLEYRVFLSLAEYEACISDTRHRETVCYKRPCLVRWGGGTGNKKLFRLISQKSNQWEPQVLQCLRHWFPALKIRCSGMWNKDVIS